MIFTPNLNKKLSVTHYKTNFWASLEIIRNLSPNGSWGFQWEISKKYQSWYFPVEITATLRIRLTSAQNVSLRKIMESKHLNSNESFPQSRACEFWTWNRIWSITSCTRGLEFWFGYHWNPLNESYKLIFEHTGRFWGESWRCTFHLKSFGSSQETVTISEVQHQNPFEEEGRWMTGDSQ